MMIKVMTMICQSGGSMIVCFAYKISAEATISWLIICEHFSIFYLRHRVIIVLITILNQISIHKKQQDTPRSWSTVENAQILFRKEMSGKPLKLSVGNCSQLRPPVNLHLERKLFYSIVLKHKSPQMFDNVNIQINRVSSSNNGNIVLLFN